MIDRFMAARTLKFLLALALLCVATVPLSGGKATPVLTGFVAPTVGLGVNAGKLYVGELTGQVFSVTP